MQERRYTLFDRHLIELDHALATLFGRPRGSARRDPAAEIEESPLEDEEKRRSARLMRVNHCGEVCAQALYQGQALTIRTGNENEDRDKTALRRTLRQAALEEGDHLQWCESRIKQLNGRTSILNPLFYFGSFSLGALAGRMGQRWNLGFLAETERQVVRHLDQHLRRLPENDHKSRAILDTMRQDEAQHATAAAAGGGARLPLPVRLAMSASSKIMTKTAYWL